MEYSCERPLILCLHPSLLSSFTLSPVFGWAFLPKLVIKKPNQANPKTQQQTQQDKQTKTPQQTLNVNRRFTEECNQEWCCKSSLESDYQEFKNFQLFAITVVIAILKCFPFPKEMPCC